jgi:purine-nucleoside phosphorylase
MSPLRYAPVEMTNKGAATMTISIYDAAEEARDFILSRLPVDAARPRIALVLGSGLGAFADRLDAPVFIPFRDIPHFSQSTVEGHSGRLVIGAIHGIPVAVMQGRVHGYEGYSAQQVTFPVRVLGLLGVETMIVTNAAGGINTGYRQGQLVVLSDHINLTGSNPLIGPNDERLGLRFFDMSEAYSKRLRGHAHAAAVAIGIEAAEGVYLGLSGPNFETPAEIRAFRTLGADLVGMSTVHEVIVARHMGIEVLGISCVTNMAAGVLDQPLNHEEVIETGERVKEDFARLLVAILPLIAA